MTDELKAITFKPSWWARFFRQVQPDYKQVTLQFSNINIQSISIQNTIPYDKIIGIRKEKQSNWYRIHLSLSSETTIILSGLKFINAKKLYSQLFLYKANYNSVLERLKILDQEPAVEIFYLWLEERRKGNYWVSQYDIECATAKIEALNLNEILKLSNVNLTDNHTINKMFLSIKDFSSDPNKFRILSNERFLSLELKRFKNYFDSVESEPLTISQRQAIITHEDNTLVIAGAGSGKTSVIVAKAGYLIRKSICKENEILLISFNRLAAEEMTMRIKSRIKANVKATTFHALGLEMISEVEKRKPSLAKTAGNKTALRHEIQGILIYLLKNKKTTHLITTYFQSFFAPYKSELDFDELGDYYKYIKTHELFSLDGIQLKSYEEVEIANFLILNGIKYEYEKPYPINTATITHSQYEPDFYLTDSNIYIEHFGIKRDGSTAPHINQQEYTDGMNWKRNVHRDNDTTLIETYSYEKSEGILLDNLKTKLNQHGVELHPIDPEKVLQKLKNTNYFNPLVALTATFLNHFKGGCYSINEVRERARSRGILDPRLKAFLLIFEQVLERYDNYLSMNNVIDFNDMINKAANYVEHNKYLSPYKCILVDEFQDISINRARLIKMLSQQKPNNKLFCVGDDWQAIYRFAGSDISFMSEFESNFGFTQTVKLDQTFRFNDKIEAVTTKFVLKNTKQIKKTIQTIEKIKEPQVILHRPEKENDDIFIEVLKEINERSDDNKNTILCLGRYNYLQDGLSWSIAKEAFKNFKITFKTVHSAKGLEEDYVIVLGMRSGKYGFPSEITDDPIIDAVLSEPENYLHAEERRLFYVALTRARKAVHLIVDHSSPSCFVSEIKKYKGLVESLGYAGIEPVYCPSCATGELIQRTGQYSTFYGCQNFPLCTYKTSACTKCGLGILVYDETKRYYMCNNMKCSHRERPCPRCKIGRLVERSGRNGVFFGCTNYYSGQCRYTEEID